MSDSYYGRPILKEPAWKVPDVPVYLFLGGMAGASAGAAVLADVAGSDGLRRTTRLVAAGAATASVGALVHDLGRPARFLSMLRVVKPTSPLSVGSWILAPFSGLTAVAALTELTGRFTGVGRLAGGAAGALGPAMCTYTAVLLADTATPSWHEMYRELPFLFAGSAMASAAGAGLLWAPPEEQGPMRRLGWLGTGVELVASKRIERDHGLLSEPYRTGRARVLLRAGQALGVAGAALSALSGLPALRRRRRLLGALGGAAYLAGGLCTRFGVFDAGVASSRDPRYVVEPQRATKVTAEAGS